MKKFSAILVVAVMLSGICLVNAAESSSSVNTESAMEMSASYQYVMYEELPYIDLAAVDTLRRRLLVEPNFIRVVALIMQKEMAIIIVYILQTTIVTTICFMMI